MELCNIIQSGCEAGIYQPLLAYIRSKKLGLPLPNYTPDFHETAIHKLAKLALMFHEAGFETKAAELSVNIQKLKDFPTLWCKEEEFVASKIKEVLFRASKLAAAPSDCKLDVTLVELPSLRAALTTTGNGTSLGAIQCGDVRVQAFGPQSSTLKFGIRGQGMDGWVQTFAFPEVWLNMVHEIEMDRLQLKINMVGLKTEEPLSIAFYVQANDCQIGNKVYQPKSLERFNSPTNKIVFQNQFTIEIKNSINTQVIPLAGEGCFWDSNFLVLMEINPFMSQISLSLS